MAPADGRDGPSWPSWILLTVGVVTLLMGAAWWFAAPEQATSPAAPARQETSSAPGSAPGSALGSTPPTASKETSAPQATGTQARAAPPRLVRIPSLRIVAPVDPVRAAAGTLVPPDDPMRLGWWSDGARPGDRRGSVLITGHAVRNGDGALDELADLEPGARVVVTTTRGDVPYAVQRVRVFHKGTVARHAGELFAQEGPGRLVLVTCADWDGERYLSNVVATGKPLR